MPDKTAQISPMLESALNAIRQAVEGLTDDQLSWHPEGKWSAAGILEHLSLAYGRTTERMMPLLDHDPAPARKRTFRESVGNILVLKFGYIPAGRKAPQALVPVGLCPAEARTCIEEKMFELDRAIAGCETRFGNEKKVLDHAILGPLSASEWRKFHCVHTLHHMKQVWALREKMGVTGSASSAVPA